MEEQEILSQVVEIFKEELDNEEIELTMESTAKDIEELSNAKDKLFSDISGLEKVKIDPSTLSVAGLSGLQSWLDNQKQLLTADLKARKMRPPRGVLLVGVPGCGKSLSAKFIAANWNLPLYRQNQN